MIDAFYQSLVCFFIPYFVSLVLISISSSSLVACCSYLLIISSLFAPSPPPILSPGLRWLWRGSVYMGNSHHHPGFIHHSGALGHWDQNLGKEPNFRLFDGNTWRFLLFEMPPLSLSAASSHSNQSLGFVRALVWRLTGTWIFNSGWLDWTRKLYRIRAYISAWQRVCLHPGPLQTVSTTSQHTTATHSSSETPVYFFSPTFPPCLGFILRYPRVVPVKGPTVLVMSHFKFMTLHWIRVFPLCWGCKFSLTSFAHEKCPFH